jgi:hypothetical protein
MKVKGGLSRKKKGTIGKGEMRKERLMGELSMIKTHYIHVYKCHSESHYFDN